MDLKAVPTWLLQEELTRRMSLKNFKYEELRVEVKRRERIIAESLRKEEVERQGHHKFVFFASKHFGYEPDLFVSNRRAMPLAEKRQVAMAAMRETGESYSFVGEMFGGRDHGTVSHALRKVAGKPSLKSQMIDLVAAWENQKRRQGEAEPSTSQ